jgi:short-subunit dehydrogenase
MALPSPAPDRTALVTGASSGIGAEIARELARRGHGVTLVARREERLTALAGELSGVRVEVITADLGVEGERQRVVDEIASRGLLLDVLVNNAGLSTQGPVSLASAPAELAMVRLDVEAVVHLCTLALRDMVERRRGAVLNVASTAAMQPLPGQAAYGASKAFVLSYTRALATELRGSGVTATALCPGPVETEFAATAGWAPEEVEGSMPKVMWVSAADVAKAGVAGLAAGKQVVIPGFANRAASVLSKLTPHGLVLPVLARSHPSLKR